MTYQQMSDKRSRNIQATIAWVFAIVTIGYMLPWAIAATRGKSNTGAIAVINFLLGWTVIGWVVALVMACGTHQAGMVVMQPPMTYAPQMQPGWYQAPTDPPGVMRYWDGQAWTYQLGQPQQST